MMNTIRFNIFLWILFLSFFTAKGQDPILNGGDIDSSEYDLSESMLKYYELKRIGLSWYERGDYAKAYHYLLNAYEKVPTDELVSIQLSHASLLLGRKSPVPTVNHDVTVGVEATWIHPSEEVSLGSQYLSVEHYSSSNGFSVQANVRHEVGDKVTLSHQLEYTNTPYTNALEVVNKRMFTDQLNSQRFEYAAEAVVQMPKGWRLSMFGRLNYSQYESVSYKFDSLAYLTSEEETSSDESNDWEQPEYGRLYRYNWYNWWEENDADFSGNEGENDWSNTYNPFDYNNYNRYNREESTQLTEEEYWDYLTKCYSNTLQKNRKVSFLVGASASYFYKHHEFMGRTSYLNYWRYQVGQLGLMHTWLPKGTLDLYFKTKVAYLWRFYPSDTIKDQLIDESPSNLDKWPVVEEIIGVKVCPMLWMEASFLYGDLKGYEDFDAKVVYLLAEDTKFRASAQAIMPLPNNLKLYLTYRLTNRQLSTVSSDITSLYLKTNSVYEHVISMGVKWKF